MWCICTNTYAYVHSHLFLQKAAKNRLFTHDQKQELFRIARRKRQKARSEKQEYKKLLPKWWKQ